MKLTRWYTRNKGHHNQEACAFQYKHQTFQHYVPTLLWLWFLSSHLWRHSHIVWSKYCLNHLVAIQIHARIYLDLLFCYFVIHLTLVCLIMPTKVCLIFKDFIMIPTEVKNLHLLLISTQRCLLLILQYIWGHHQVSN